MSIINSTPSHDGFYMPAEYEKHDGTIMIWMYKETGVKASPINPQVRKQTKEIYTPCLTTRS